MVDMAASSSTHAEGSEVTEPRYRLPYQALYAIAAVLVLASIAIVVWTLNRDTTTGPATAPPPLTTPSSSPTPTPSPTPTSPEERAAADAIAAITTYHHVTNQLEHDGGKKATEARLLKLTTANGTERKFIKIYAKDIRDRELRSTGWSKVSTRLDAVDLSLKTPRVDLAVCLDQTGVKATEAGKPIKTPRFLVYGAVLEFEEGRWLVDSEANVTADLDPIPHAECGL